MDSEADVAEVMPAEVAPAEVPADVPSVVVRYWAAARAAAGRQQDEVAPGTLADVLAAVRAKHADDRFDRVVASCSVLVGERPVNRADPSAVDVPAGATVELLPPFAGGAS